MIKTGWNKAARKCDSGSQDTLFPVFSELTDHKTKITFINGRIAVHHFCAVSIIFKSRYDGNMVCQGNSGIRNHGG